MVLRWVVWWGLEGPEPYTGWKPAPLTGGCGCALVEWGLEGPEPYTGWKPAPLTEGCGCALVGGA